MQVPRGREHQQQGENPTKTPQNNLARHQAALQHEPDALQYGLVYALPQQLRSQASW